MADTAIEELKTLQGKDAILLVRELSKAKKEAAHIVPFQTSLSFDPSTDSDSTATKDGPVNSSSSVETDLEFEFTNSTHYIADMLRHALFDGRDLEMWIVHRDRTRQNDGGKTTEAYAWYMRGKVQEDSNDNDADDLSKRDITFTVNGTPSDGWTKFTQEQQQDIDYLFRGVDIVTEEDTTGGGTAYDETKDGAGIPQASAPAA